MKTGIELIAEERQRQIEIEGWTAEHDKEEHPEWTKIVQKKDYYRLQLNLLITEYESLTKQNYEHKRNTNN